MHVLTTQDDASQEIYFVPRTAVSGTVYFTIRNRQLDCVTCTGSGTITTDGYHYVMSGTFSNMIEGAHFSIEIFSDSGRTVSVYKGVIFCTDQSISTYSINNGQYNERSTDNEYVTL